jgi:hypothetical protein
MGALGVTTLAVSAERITSAGKTDALWTARFN